MKILLLNHYYAPDSAATAQMLADLGEELARAGHEVIAVCSDRAYGAPERRYPKRETIGGVEVRRIRSTGFGRARRLGRILDYATFFWGAAIQLFTRRFDVAVCLSTPPLIGLVGVAAARGSPGRPFRGRSHPGSVPSPTSPSAPLADLTPARFPRHPSPYLRRGDGGEVGYGEGVPDLAAPLTLPSPSGGEGGVGSTPSPPGEGVPKAGVRSIFWCMDVYPELAFELGALRRESIAGRIATRLSRLILSRSDAVVALGPEMARRLEGQARREVGRPHPAFGRPLPQGEGRELPPLPAGEGRGEGTPVSPITFIHNWADGDAIRPRPAEGHPLRRSRGWDGRFVVLYSGNLGLAHDFETILAAAALLRGRGEILFAFVGSGPMLARVRRESGERQLANVEIRDPDPRSALGESLTAGDVHLVSLREGLAGLLVPSKIYGILAAGRPALYVGPEAGEVFRIVTKGSCGSAIRNGDARGLAAAIESYAGDPERRQREGENARALFESEFSKEKALAKWMTLIEGA